MGHVECNLPLISCTLYNCRVTKTWSFIPRTSWYNQTCQHFTLHKIPYFHLISWCENFMEAHSVHSLTDHPKLCRNCAFSQNFHTRKLGEIMVLFEVLVWEMIKGLHSDFLSTERLSSLNCFKIHFSLRKLWYIVINFDVLLCFAHFCYPFRFYGITLLPRNQRCFVKLFSMHIGVQSCTTIYKSISNLKLEKGEGLSAFSFINII